MPAPRNEPGKSPDGGAEDKLARPEVGLVLTFFAAPFLVWGVCLLWSGDFSTGLGIIGTALPCLGIGVKILMSKPASDSPIPPWLLGITFLALTPPALIGMWDGLQRTGNPLYFLALLFPLAASFSILASLKDFLGYQGIRVPAPGHSAGKRFDKHEIPYNLLFRVISERPGRVVLAYDGGRAWQGNTEGLFAFAMWVVGTAVCLHLDPGSGAEAHPMEVEVSGNLLALLVGFFLSSAGVSVVMSFFPLVLWYLMGLVLFWRFLAQASQQFWHFRVKARITLQDGQVTIRRFQGEDSFPISQVAHLEARSSNQYRMPTRMDLVVRLVDGKEIVIAKQVPGSIPANVGIRQLRSLLATP